MFIHEVCDALENEKVPYAIVGGYAVAFHGFMRGTLDIDVVIHWTLENLQKAEKALHRIGLISLLPIDSTTLFHFRDEYILKRNLIAWNFYHPLSPQKQVDLIINYDLKNLNHTKTFQILGTKVQVLTLKDLIKMKKKAGRPQDLIDIAALESL